MTLRLIIFFLSFSITLKAQVKDTNRLDVLKQLNYCEQQASKTLKAIPRDSIFPRTVEVGKTQWRHVKVADWTSGFWPGILWYLYDFTKDDKWRKEADKSSRFLTPLSQNPAFDHDLGFQIFCSFGNGYRLTENEDYKRIINRTSDTLATLFNPKVGTILSWPFRVESLGGHNTIIDNMMNLEMLLWSTENGGTKGLKKMALRHADVTMKNHFRADLSSYHVIVYDEKGKKKKGVTFQGESDESLWARGQAWAIYGYTMMYRETKKKKYLDFAIKITDHYLKRLPSDLIPYWDFDAPKIPNDTRDASAAAITASALLDLSKLVKPEQSDYYKDLAEKMLIELSSDRYQSREKNSAFLMHSRGSKTGEIDVAINYADYYYLESLLKFKNY
ncbi:MAG: glucuronyl hydrolase [Pedobacter sp.]|nr:MAG: glucuronyl hydrolase [Pedobacter sp.]